jgi:hypothetical protein
MYLDSRPRIMGHRSPRLDGTYPQTAGLIRFEIFIVQHERDPSGGVQCIEGLSNSITDFYRLWIAKLQQERRHDFDRVDLICRNENIITPVSPPAV